MENLYHEKYMFLLQHLNQLKIKTTIKNSLKINNKFLSTNSLRKISCARIPANGLDGATFAKKFFFFLRRLLASSAVGHYYEQGKT